MIVGLKLIDKAKIIKDKFITQFIRELKIQSFLDHPNIIKVYGSFTDDKYIYIIMELGCDGQLFDIISSGQTLT
jgi:aurora kinase